MGNEYHIVFSGTVVNGADPKTVASKLAVALKKDQSFAEALLLGKPVVLKKTKELKQAKLVITQLERVGAIAQLVTIKERVASNKNGSPGLSAANEESSSVTAKFKPELSSSTKPIQKPIDPIAVKDEPPDTKEALIAKLQYKFDSFMAKGSASSFKALLLVFLVLFCFIAVARAVFNIVSPDLAQQYESLDFLGNIYLTFLQLTDPGNMAQDILSSVWYKLFAVIAGLTGIILLSALIAVITTALDQKLSELKRGRSKIIERGHTLILGWDEQRIVEIVRELSFANESEKDACIVILADVDKQYMDDTLRLRLPNMGTTRIVTRSGKCTIFANLALVSIAHAKSIIVLASCSDTDTHEAKVASDALVIQTVLAATSQSVEKQDFAIVAEIYNRAYRRIIDDTFPEYVVTLDTANILAKLLVQTSRSVGLSTVYGELLSFDGCEMYFYRASWHSEEFSKLVYRFKDGVPIGVRQATGKLIINPENNYRMLDDDEILIVADDDSTIDYLPKPLILPKMFPKLSHKLEQVLEKELIIGWNHKTEIILREFADYVLEGSTIDVIVYRATENERKEVERINAEITNIDIQLIDLNPLDGVALKSLNPSEYGNIIILASLREGKESHQVDSENIVILLLLRSLFNNLDKDSELLKVRQTKLISEVLESQNNALIEQAGVKDTIISNRLISMVTAQISENKKIKLVYDDLFQEEGSEIYIKPLKLYFNDYPVVATFADLIAVVQQRNEVCIGVKIQEYETFRDKNNGIELIPPKEKTFRLEEGDCLVVVSEDEL